MPVSLLFFSFSRLFGLASAGFGRCAKWVGESLAHLLGAAVVLLGLVALWQHHEATKQASYARQTKAAWEAARADALAARTQAEARYRSLARDADQNHALDVAVGGTRLAAYVAARRVQPGPQADSARPAQSGSAAIPAIAATETVLAELSDLRVCEADYAYAKAAHEWAQSLDRGGLNAKP